MDKWAKRFALLLVQRIKHSLHFHRGVQGHHDDSKRPWMVIEETVTAQTAAIVGVIPQHFDLLCRAHLPNLDFPGALPSEVIVMNTLSVNLHLLMVRVV
jgi:hypothetical protein